MIITSWPKIDADFYNWLYTDKTDPWMTNPTAADIPGSTFKMVLQSQDLKKAIDPYEDTRPWYL